MLSIYVKALSCYPVVFMLGISNVILQEQRFIDNSATMIEVVDEQGYDEPFD